MAERRIRNGERTSGLPSRVGPMLGLGLLGGLLLTAGVLVWAQTATDPGPRTGLCNGAPCAGTFQNGLTAYEKKFEAPTEGQFTQQFIVPASGALTCSPPNTECTVQSNTGLGPRFNSNSCASCHAQPAVGGSSPPSNPLFGVYQLNQSNCTSNPSNCNSMPSFEKSNGPVRVARFPYQISNLSVPDGMVHQLFTVTGRSDAGSCSLEQPDFAEASGEGNLTYRQPLPTFGDGYIEIVENTDILNNLNSNLAQKQALGIGGAVNIADDGTVNRLGWKDQWRAILPAAGAEENVEMGVTNEMFPTETDQTNPNCLTNPVPEDYTNYAYSGITVAGAQVPTFYPWSFPEGADRDAIFIRFLEQPTPGQCIADTAAGETSAQTCQNGRTQFNNAGCVLCHTTSYMTPAGSIPSMGHVTINLYSDLLLHHMGPCLADNIVQGSAQGDMWRTPPLWNVGQRYFFMHDGRTYTFKNPIVQAVEDHHCLGNSQYPPSEANAVIDNFNALSRTNQQDLIYFLRSL
jgi:CxxC motif-containing protein (DUF1111 family)